MGRKIRERAVDGGTKMSKGQLAYEQRRADEAGVSLDAWLKRKTRDAAAAAPKAAAVPARKGLIGRLLDRAHKPL